MVPVTKDSPVIISPEQLNSLKEIHPNSFHILRKSIDIVPEWPTNGSIGSIDSILSQYNVLYSDGDPVLLYVGK